MPGQSTRMFGAYGMPAAAVGARVGADCRASLPFPGAELA